MECFADMLGLHWSRRHVIANLVFVLVAIGHGQPSNAAAPDDHGSLPRWSSQYGQDRLIYERFFVSRGKKPGVFIELGAADGLDKSNTESFERLFGWSGVLIEPSVDLFAKLKQNRPNSICVNECVSRMQGNYYFSEDGYSSGFTAHRGFEVLKSPGEGGGDIRKCRTLSQILDQHLGRFAHIDYLSLDLEGGELDVLLSLDFTRHTVDVISLEVHEWREQERAALMASLLEQRGFQFVDRLVVDEIWVRKGSLMPDPTCGLPGLLQASANLQGGDAVGPPAGGWGMVRETLTRLLPFLREAFGGPGTFDVQAFSSQEPQLMEALMSVIALWNGWPSQKLETQCPIGLLVMALAASLLPHRHSGLTLDGGLIGNELRQHTIFLPTLIMHELAEAYGESFQEAVTQSELQGEEFGVRLPLGKAWHLVSFIDAVESGWPLFGYLDLVGDVATRMKYHNRVNLHGNEYNLPYRIARLPCALEAKDDNPVHIRVISRIRKQRAPRSSSKDLALDTDACGLLGLAVSYVHDSISDAKGGHKRAEKSEAHFVALANWTVHADCFKAQSGRVPSTPKSDCSALSIEACGALDERSEPVPRHCLRELVRRPGTSLRIRTPPRLFGTLAGNYLTHGERLFREFVHRHGLYSTMSTLAASEMRLFGSDDSSDPGLSMFGMLHSFQQAHIKHHYNI
eukprot:TRINITY_DN71501_c0_g1_i1.p1 TRINITY_DN71501_c0_g1~~TRINITY_DN71501_c0_g1_i1.p1  ORF type:complete len:685 (+),score=58.46 TRINITY_DN71501_c0_g1_i1:44-2098(+)